MAERGVATVRWAVVAFNSIVYGLMIYPAGHPPLAWSIVVAANLYSLMVVLWPPRFSKALQASLWTASTDAALIVAWLWATGGAQSPFFLLWALSLVALAFRFGPRVTQASTVVYVLLDMLILSLDGALDPTPLIAVRLGYLVLLGALLSFMAASAVDVLGREMELARTLRKLRQSERELETVLEHAPSLIVRVDREGKVLFANRDVGPDFRGLASPEDVDLVEAALEVVIEEGVEHVVEHRDPTGGQFQTRVSPILQGGVPIGAIMLGLDVTQQKHRERLAAEAEAKDAAMARLEERDAFRRSFLNAAAHELNTPLTPLKLQVDVLRRRMDDPAALDLLDRNIKRLATLVDDLVQVSRMEAGKARLMPAAFDLATLLDEAAHTFAPQAKERQVMIHREYPSPLEVYGDPTRISQVIYNLLSNATKYATSTIQVTAQWQGRELIVTVADDGPGLEAAQIARMFRPFEQVHESRHQKPGTGLGLFIAKSVMEAHRGDLTVSSGGAGAGANFVFAWPARPPA